FVQEVCRKIGYPPDPIRLPQSWDEVAETTAAPPAESAEAADREPADDWSPPPADSAAGRPMPKSAKPDSS
ncbi:hypothetical protein, partial [Inquilinus sp. OTU3971]|uniref:hypothetical protein n=1 Tax=Inquilinus sp. OTU3971 TaxID=3043855 RepID=UPI00313F0319